MNALDRMYLNNENSGRMNQASRLLKTAAEVALLAAVSAGIGTVAGAGAKAATGAGKVAQGGAKVASGAGKAASGAKAGYSTLGQLTAQKLKDPKFLKGLEKAGKFVGKAALNKVKGEAEQQFPHSADFEKLKGGLANLKDGVATIKASAVTLDGVLKGEGEPNKIVDTVSGLLLGKADLTHGVIGAAAKVLKGTENAPPSARLQKYLATGLEGLEEKRKLIIMDLLKDTREMLETAKEDAEADDRSEAAIKQMRKA